VPGLRSIEFIEGLGGWAESTIKSYIRGAVVKDPSTRENVLRIFSHMVDGFDS
jgi:hypothetical protein